MMFNLTSNDDYCPLEQNRKRCGDKGTQRGNSQDKLHGKNGLIETIIFLYYFQGETCFTIAPWTQRWYPQQEKDPNMICYYSKS